MSFGLSSGGGQVRYAVVFDSTQAEQNVRRYQTSLQQLATGTTGVSGKMAIMNNSFTAGLSPIKNTGNALNQLSTTQKTIGTQLGGLGKAFKSNALAIGAAASSVLGLYQNYANLSSAQNAANKSATAAKAAQNSVTTATKNLKKAQDEYGKSSKEAKDAQAKLTVAQERAVNKTESAKIAQDNLNQTMADFGINILPNVILAGGSIVSIFDNIGKSGSGVMGVFSKLGGASGLGGLIDKFKTAGTSAGGLKSNLLGLGVTTAVIGGITFGAIELAKAMNQLAAKFTNAGPPVSALETKLDASGKSLKTWNLTVAETEAAARAGVSPAIFALDSLFGTHMTENILKSAGALDKNGKIIVNFDGKAKALGETIKTIPPSMNTATTSTDAWVNMMIRALQSTDPAKIIEFNKAFKESGQPVERYTQILNEATAMINKAKAAAAGAVAPINALMDVSLQLDKSFISLNPSLAGFTGETAKAGDKLFFAANKMGVFTGKTGELQKTTMAATQATITHGQKVADAAAFIQKYADANANAANKMSDFELAITAGNQKFNDFVTTTELAAVTNKRYHDALLQTVGAQVRLPPALDLTTSQLESVQQALDNAAVGLTENSNASKILADALDQQLAPSIQKLGGALTALNSKEFKKAFKELDFGAAGKKFKEFASDLDRNISKINEEAGRMETIFSQLSVALSIDKLPHKQWVAGLEGIRKEIDKIGKTQKIDLSGITTFIAKAETIKDPVQLAKYQKVIALIVESSKGGFNATELIAINTAIKGTGESAGTAAPKLDAAQAALVKFGREASAVVTITASMSASMVTSVGTAVDFVTKALAGIANIQVPTPNESTYQKGLQLAIDNAAQTVKFITTKLMQISGIKVPTPNESKYQKGLQLAIDNAAQTKKFIEKELNKIGGIKVPAPKFNNFNSALDQAVSDAKRAVRDINNALTKVKKPSGGGGGDGKGPGATTGPFNSDTSSFSKSNSGDTIVNLNISGNEIVNEQKLTRRVKRSMGTDRYRFGLG